MKAREDEAMASLRAKCAMQIAQSDDRFGWKLEGLGGVRNERHSWALKFEVSAISYIPFLAPSTVRRSTVSNNLAGWVDTGSLVTAAATLVPRRIACGYWPSPWSVDGFSVDIGPVCWACWASIHFSAPTAVAPTSKLAFV